jgi:hypothetical protein
MTAAAKPRCDLVVRARFQRSADPDIDPPTVRFPRPTGSFAIPSAVSPGSPHSAAQLSRLVLPPLPSFEGATSGRVQRPQSSTRQTRPPSITRRARWVALGRHVVGRNRLRYTLEVSVNRCVVACTLLIENGRLKFHRSEGGLAPTSWPRHKRSWQRRLPLRAASFPFEQAER